MEKTGILQEIQAEKNAYTPPEIDIKSIDFDIDDDESPDFNEETDEKDSEESDKYFSKEEKKDKSTTREIAETSARQTIHMLDIVTGKICMVIAKDDTDEKYRMSKTDLKDAILVTADYIEIKGDFLTPEQKFFSYLITIVGFNLLNAITERRRKEKVKNKAQSIRQQMPIEFFPEKNVSNTEQNLSGQIIKKYDGKRRQFNIHKSTKCYSKTADGGTYLSLAEADERAADWVLKIIEQGEKNRKSQKEINNEILSILDEMAENDEPINLSQ